MRQWYYRTASTVILAAMLPKGLHAQAPAPVAPIPPPIVRVPALVPNGVPVPGAPVLPPGAVMAPEAFRAATPYNATVIGRAAPNPMNNRPNMTIPCVNPNQNFAPLELTPPEAWVRLCDFWHHFTHFGGDGCCSTCGGCDGFLPSAPAAGGCGSGSCGTPVAMKSANTGEVAQVGFFTFIKSNCDSDPRPTVCGVGSCATCGNTANFIFGSSRSFFGESSREFFERPPSVDGVRFKVNPPPVIYRQRPYDAPPCPSAIPPTNPYVGP